MLQHQQPNHYVEYDFDDSDGPDGSHDDSAATFLAALIMLGAISIVVLLLWAPWRSAGTSNQPIIRPVPPSPAPVAQQSAQPDQGPSLVPQSPGSAGGR